MDRPDIRLATQADFPSEQVFGLETTIFTGPDFADRVDLVHSVLGERISSGDLFAYLFRRFGYPNRGWDNHKELCAYLFTTSKSDMLMRVGPCGSEDPALSFKFMVPWDARMACEDWTQRSRYAWHVDLAGFLEKQGLPSWMEDLAATARAEGCPQRPDLPDWFAGIELSRMRSYLHEMDTARGKDSGEDIPEEVSWWREMSAAFEADHPWPDADDRAPDWRDWEADDPMTPYAAAISETLRELTRPVFIRDVPIGLRGVMSNIEAMDTVAALDGEIDAEHEVPGFVDRAVSAGYAIRAELNADPAMMARLHAAVLRAGEGDLAAGVEAVLAKLSEGGGNPFSQDG